MKVEVNRVNSIKSSISIKCCKSKNSTSQFSTRPLDIKKETSKTSKSSKNPIVKKSSSTIFNSLIISLEKNLYDDSLKYLKKIFMKTNNPPTNFFLDFCLCLINLKCNQFENFKRCSNSLIQNIGKLDDTILKSIKTTEINRKILTYLVINQLEKYTSTSKLELSTILKPLLKIENYNEFYFKSKHNILITSLIIQYIFATNIGIKKVSPTPTPSLNSKICTHVGNIINAYLCINTDIIVDILSDEKCNVCLLAKRIIFLLNNLSITSDKILPRKNKTVNSVCAFNDDNLISSNNLSFCKTRKEFKKASLVSNSKLIVQSRNINTDEENNSLNSIEQIKKIKNTDKAPIKGSLKNNFSNFQKYIKNTKRIKENSKLNQHPSQIRSFLSISSNNRIDPKYCIETNIRNTKINKQIFTEKDESNQFTCTNTVKHDNSLNTNHTCEQYSSCSNINKSNMYKSNFMENEKKNSCTNILSQRWNNYSYLDHSVRARLHNSFSPNDHVKIDHNLKINNINSKNNENNAIINQNLQNIFEITSKNKIKTKKWIPCKVDTCNYNISVDSQKHLKIKLLKNSYKEFALYKIGKIDKDNYKKPINEIIKNIEKDLQLMEFTLKDFQENNSEIRNFLIKI